MVPIAPCRFWLARSLSGGPQMEPLKRDRGLRVKALGLEVEDMDMGLS